MTFRVRILASAKKDIGDIYAYIALNDSIERARPIANGLESMCLSLEDFPHRGHIVPELERMGVQAYSEIHYNHFRIVYEVREKDVYIHAILDGRRDLQRILERRIIRS